MRKELVAFGRLRGTCEAGQRNQAFAFKEDAKIMALVDSWLLLPSVCYLSANLIVWLSDLIVKHDFNLG